jgi:lysophospholipid acyltransferase (LPLAT)-like uncharacterized protein
LVFYLYYGLCYATSRIVIDGGRESLRQHAIYCLWHKSWWPFFIVCFRFRSKVAMINHPAAYMKPLHFVLHLMGLKHLILGSGGEEGRLAAQKLSLYVKEGHSTFISPDGPAGPAQKLKKGVLFVALESGVPIVPISLRSTPSIPFPTWDAKRFPLPFSYIRVKVAPPLSVCAENFAQSEEALTRALDSLDCARALR